MTLFPREQILSFAQDDRIETMTNLKGGGPEKFGAFRSFFYQLWAEPSLEPLHRRISSEIPIVDGRLLVFKGKAHLPHGRNF
jgi:hypothetical protein